MKTSKLLVIAILLLVSAVSVSASLVTNDGTPYYTTLNEATSAAQKAGVPTVIKFYTDWCVWCKVMDTGTFAKEKTIQTFSKDMVLAKINAEVDTVIAKKYSVSAYPTLVMLDKNGEEIDRIVGYLPQDEFLKTLADYQSGVGTLGDLLNQSKTKSDRSLAFQIADKYKYRGKLDDASQWYKKVIEQGDAKDSLAGESRMAMADMLRRDKKWDQALTAFGSIATDFKGTPFSESAQLWQAIVYGKKGDTTMAVTAYQNYIKNNPKADPDDIKYANEQIEKLTKNKTAAQK